jgi:hypothetical protein
MCSRWAGVALLSLSVVGCALIGVEPDEIDLAMGSESEAGEGETGDGNSGEGAEAGQDEAMGDGDGDPNAEVPCEELGATPLALGPNEVMIPAEASSLEGTCGHDGPERVYSFISEEAGNVQFTLTADFDAALYAVDDAICLPLVELSCVNTPESLTVAVEAQQLVHVVVDSAVPDGGTGTLDVALVP